MALKQVYFSPVFVSGLCLFVCFSLSSGSNFALTTNVPEEDEDFIIVRFGFANWIKR